MSLEMAITLAAALFFVAYLIYALLYPEKL